MGLVDSYKQTKQQGLEAKANAAAAGAGLNVPYRHLDLPAEVFLAQVIAGVGAIKGVRVERPGPNNVTIHHRYTPGWAVVFGILGLFLFLLGALLFFIKRTDTVSVIAADDASGCNVTVSGKGPIQVAQVLGLLVNGQAEENYRAALAPAV